MNSSKQPAIYNSQQRANRNFNSIDDGIEDYFDKKKMGQVATVYLT